MREQVQRSTSSKEDAPRPRFDPRGSDGERWALLRLAQAKLTVGAAGDHYEREADQVADRVMAVIQRLSAGSPSAPIVDVNSHRCGPACVHRHGGGRGPEVGPDGGHLDDSLSSRVMQAAGTGAPLAEPVRRSMESAFGTDFSSVRVHPDSEVAPRIGASAFTLGHDIHFASGQYRPADRSGMWLLSHELTHVVQQTGGIERQISADGPAVRRHSSKEHFILGTLTPAQIREMAVAKDDAAVAKGTGVLNKVGRMFGQATPTANTQAVQNALHTIAQQLLALNRWRGVTTPVGGPQVKKGSTEYNAEWGGQLATVTCLNGTEVPCTIGDLNALPDFFGSFDDLSTVSASIVFKTFQVIRRETYIYLKELQAQLQGLEYEYDRKTEGFGGIADNNVSLPNAKLPDFGNAAADVMQTTSMLAGKGGETGLDASVGADATLGRNACHFPPESWLRWRDLHMKARAKIATATDYQDLKAKANDAIAMNAFGEHYLQDSFAAGHLINKGFVMAVAMEHVSLATKKARGMTKAKTRALQQATAHSAAYDVPSAAKARTDALAQGQLPTPGVLENRSATTARDPQSALESAKRVGHATAGTQAQKRAAAKQEEMDASGITPGALDFDEYRTWLNDFWLQKITNTLHDKYCLKGLMVSSPDQRNLFRVYGDANMIRSAAGAEYTAETSRLSRTAINTLVDNKRTLLSPVPPGRARPAPQPVTTVNQILARFPDEVVDDDGTVMPLKDWATGKPMRDKIKALVDFFTTERWKEGKLTGVVKGLSIGKDVAPGLSPAHGPF